MLRLLAAFVLRDFLVNVSYRLSFMLDLGSVVFRAFTFFFVSQLLGESISPMLADYNGDYFSFVIIGLAFGGYFGVGLSGFASAIRSAQTNGTLEAMLMTPAPLPIIVLGSAAWSYMFTTIRVIVYVGLGGLFLGLNLSNANLLGALAVLVLSVTTFASIGIIAASVIMVIKRGDPITALVGSVSFLVGGIYYPVEILPDWLRWVADVIPLTYGLHGMRLALLNGAPFADLLPDMAVLAVYTIVVFPISLWIFNRAVERARRDGSVSDF